ncbi:MAG: hypothetical protein OIF34_13805, partial [Porticoccaceae bacterium]|nr:hypothetical protein [Porticoccaceae bacterium]
LKMHLSLELIVAAIGCLCVVLASPQYYPVKPEENWRSVILSRNGPSTTTTPRPTRWTTTTLRNFGVEPITGTGRGSVEQAKVANRPRDLFKQNRAQPHTGGSSCLAWSTSGLIVSALMTLVAVVAL